MKVKLKDIIEGIEMQSEELRSFFNLKTGEVVYVPLEALSMAEEGEEVENLSDWQQDDVETAIDIIENFDAYVSLPTSFEINEYKMIEGFCFSLSDNNKRDMLLNSIKGKGAFRRFRDNVNRLGIERQWYEYRDNCYKEIARELCESNNIGYID
ncbi:hypothetical protein HHO41_22005 [Bacillus sp. DNRA2]|uniref:UPF0158 family protein n=1 Tax=Bacillus sp. DNRA2 TaxID=2723053 RepID=UPI00145F5A29|nr:UPF0158 family protein [Bacillus sp. DNRA2]NMD72893.1 hypothetical protein [Bacillus sp. DNRA2]